jgi:hypothetical protein
MECFVGTDDGSLQVRVTLNEPPHKLFHSTHPITGLVHFEHCRLRIVSVEVQLVRRESVQDVSESVAVHRQQVIDGLVYTGDLVHFTFLINGNIPQVCSSSGSGEGRLFTVEYSVAVVFVEAGGARSYFKQLPISLWREPYDERKRCFIGLNEPYSL